jgi:hypothetical protein
VEQFFAHTILHLPDSQPVTEKGIADEALPDMLALFGRSQPPQALDFAHLFGAWRERAQQQMATVANTDELRNDLRSTLAAEWPERVSASRDGEHVTLSRPGAGDRVTALYRKGNSQAVLVVHPEGEDPGWKLAQQNKLAAGGQTLLALTVFQTGKSAAPRNRSHQHFLTFNVSDDAARVQDILTALRFLQTDGAQTVRIVADGRAAWWATFAAAASAPEFAIHLEGSKDDLQDTEAAYTQRFNVPGILRCGGLRTANRLIAARANRQ